jgi:hypothetical protein
MSQIGKLQAGMLYTTPGAWEAMREAGNPYRVAEELLSRHRAGDWGDLSPEDRLANEGALEDGSRILSAYVLSTGTRIWAITEAKDDEGRRAATTLLLPSEY